MPELPEVETIARGLAKRVTGDVVESVWLGRKKEPLKSSATDIAAALEQSRIAAVRRMGKHIVFDLDRGGRALPSAGSGQALPSKGRGANGKPRGSKARPKSAIPDAEAGEGARPTQSQWIVHLGMTGRLQVCEPKVDLEKHTHAILRLSSGRELRFVDPRRFGRLSVALAADFDAVGVEPLDVELEPFLILFRGVGNIYADESLFRAGIRPRRRASTITRAQMGKLFVHLKDVLTEAIALGGSSISDYVDADGKEGFFQLEHRVYGREGEPCLVCKTLIRRVVIAGRSSHFCPKCQK
jgi:formamidopyrimidine-DNA glycosylase